MIRNENWIIHTNLWWVYMVQLWFIGPQIATTTVHYLKNIKTEIIPLVDVLYYANEDLNVFKGTDVRIRTDKKMNGCKGFFEFMLEIVQVWHLMTSNRPRKKRGKIWKRYLWAREQYQRWSGRNCQFQLVLRLVESFPLWRQTVHARRGGRSERGTCEQENIIEDELLEMVSSYAAWDWYSPGVYDVEPSMEGEEEESKQGHAYNRIETKINWWKTFYLILIYILMGMNGTWFQARNVTHYVYGSRFQRNFLFSRDVW